MKGETLRKKNAKFFAVKKSKSKCGQIYENVRICG